MTKKFLPFVILVVVLAAFSGAGYSGMTMDAQGDMSRCPVMEVSTVCRMSPLEHLAAWQRMFVAFPQKDMRALLLLVLFGISAIFALRDFFRSNDALFAFGRVVLRRAGVPPIGRALQEAFSQGILNSKIF